MNNIIVFNALQTSLSGGIGRYSYELSKELYLNNKNIKIVIREQDIDLFKFANKEDLILARGINNSNDRNIYEQFKLPRLIYKIYPNAIIHYPDSMAPLLAKNKVIITVHDLAFKSLRDVFTWKTVLWKNFSTKLSVKKANKIIAITNFTKEEILKHYSKVDNKKIKVVYNGFNNFTNQQINEVNIRDSIKLIHKPYILTVSTISPRKNIDGLIKAFNEIKDEISENLVIAGADGWMYEHVHRLVYELNLSHRVIFTGKVNDDELKVLYKNAKFFVYVSFYEGFGLPPLEAMSYEIPCIVSNTTSIPEIVGEAAIKVNPKNINEIANSLKEMSKNMNLRDNIVNLGKKQIVKFSWKKCSSETFKLY